MKCDTLEAYFAWLRQTLSAIVTPASPNRLSFPVRVLFDPSLTWSIQVGPICASAPLRVLFDHSLTRFIQVNTICGSASLKVLVGTARAESICVGPSRVTFDSRLVPSSSSRRHSLPNIRLSDCHIEQPKQNCGDFVRYFLN